MCTQAQWSRLFDTTVEECRRLARVKGGEYSGDDDRLRNFRRAGEDQGLAAEVIWRVYAGKHWDAIGQHIKDIREGRDRVKGEPIEGRAHDLIVYLILFLAMVEERKGGYKYDVSKVREDAIVDKLRTGKFP